MKNFMLIAALFFSFNLFGQIYTFDKVITTETEINGKIIKSDQSLINSKSKDYTLFLCAENTAILWDRKTFTKHYFKVSYGANDVISFSYERSCDESQNIKKEEKEATKTENRVEKIGENEFLLGTYKSSKSKRPFESIQITIKESNEDQLEILHTISAEFKDKLNEYLDLNKDYTTVKMKFSKSGRTIKLKEVVDYTTQIKLPKNLNFKCENNLPNLIRKEI